MGRTLKATVNYSIAVVVHILLYKWVRTSIRIRVGIPICPVLFSYQNKAWTTTELDLWWGESKPSRCKRAQAKVVSDSEMQAEFNMVVLCRTVHHIQLYFLTEYPRHQEIWACLAATGTAQGTAAQWKPLKWFPLMERNVLMRNAVSAFQNYQSAIVKRRWL